MKTLFSMIPDKKKIDSDNFFYFIIRISTIFLAFLFLGIVSTLIWHSNISLEKIGINFITSFKWSPSKNCFGSLTILIGSLTTSCLAMIVSVPISLGIAISITEWLPKKIGVLFSRFIELMAGIPSIIYGMWGLFIFVPIMSKNVQPFLIQVFQKIPILNFIFGGIPIGIGVFTAGIVLGIMVIPLISSMIRDILYSIPIQLKESAYAVGATRWEIVKNILLPYAREGILGSIILGFGRAIGETMAVTFVIGNSHKLFSSLFMPGTTISATIANEFSEAYEDIYQSALIELGLLLFAITLIILTISRYLLRRTNKNKDRFL